MIAAIALLGELLRVEVGVLSFYTLDNLVEIFLSLLVLSHYFVVFLEKLCVKAGDFTY
jgi:hypothetical protein